MTASDPPATGGGTAADPAVGLRAAAGRRVVRGRRIAVHTAKKAWRDRVLGLAAEAGFWQLLSLPPLLLAVLGAIGYVGDALGHSVTARVEDSLLHAAGRLLTEHNVHQVVQPTVDEILRTGRPDVISIGFVISLWTGSTAMATFVNTITIAYGLRHRRSAVRSRVVALVLYLAQVLSGIVIIPALILGPSVLLEPLHGGAHKTARSILALGYWPAVALLSLGMLTALYHLSPPVRPPWRRALPGAILALVLWLVGAYGLRLYLQVVFTNELTYGALGAPVAVLLFFYITALAVLLGAELNASLELLHPSPPRDSATRVRRWRRQRA